MTTSSLKAVTRETSAYVRDKGMRPVLATITGGCIVLRAKGLRTREIVDVAWLYQHAVKQRVAEEKAERKAARRGKRK